MSVRQSNSVSKKKKKRVHLFKAVLYLVKYPGTD